MNDVVRQLETMGRWLFGTHFATLIGLGVCWAGLKNVDRAEWPPAILALVVVSLYLALANFVAAALFRSCDSPLAIRFINLAAVATLSGVAGPLVSAFLWRG